jgi:hypothetical protein
MKKLMQMMLVICLVLASVQIVSASGEKVTADKDFELSSIHRLAIADPQYTPIKDGVTKADISNMIYVMGEKARLQLIPNDVISKSLQRDKKVDLTALDKKQADAAFQANIADYADAYMVATVVHNDRVVIFYDIYSAANNKLVYTYQVVADRTDPDTLATYQELTKKFYRAFDKSVQKQIKDSEKAK